jgi:hypothetical protein
MENNILVSIAMPDEKDLEVRNESVKTEIIWIAI